MYVRARGGGEAAAHPAIGREERAECQGRTPGHPRLGPVHRVDWQQPQVGYEPRPGVGRGPGGVGGSRVSDVTSSGQGFRIAGARPDGLPRQ